MTLTLETGVDSHDVAVVGAGLAGALSALALAREGLSVALIGRTPRQADGRTTALVDPSIAILESLDLWAAIAPKSAPLAAIRIIDGTKRLLRAPTVTFRSVDVGLPAFGHNIPNAHLNAVLADAIAAQPAITRVDAMLETVTEVEGAARLLLDDGRALTARLVVAADGRKSVARAAAGIDVKTWTYPQTALVLNFSHRLPHESISNEFHTEAGPFTQVPLPGNRSSLVWVQPPAEAADRAELDIEALSLAVERRMQSMLGTVTVEPGAQRFDLSGMRAHRFGAGRTVLIGEAGHAFPPIGAQGLNLISATFRPDRPHPRRRLCADRSRRPLRPAPAARHCHPHGERRSSQPLAAVGFPAGADAAGGGLHLLSVAGPLRGAVMREGIEPGSALKAAGAVSGKRSDYGKRSGARAPERISTRSPVIVTTEQAVVIRTVAEARSGQTPYCWPMTKTLVAVGSAAQQHGRPDPDGIEAADEADAEIHGGRMHDQLQRHDVADLRRHALQRPERQRDAHGKEGAGRSRLREIIDQPLRRLRHGQAKARKGKAGHHGENEGMEGDAPCNRGEERQVPAPRRPCRARQWPWRSARRQNAARFRSRRSARHRHGGLFAEGEQRQSRAHIADIAIGGGKTLHRRRLGGPRRAGNGPAGKAASEDRVGDPKRREDKIEAGQFLEGRAATSLKKQRGRAR